jgi:hypothetical protein
MDITFRETDQEILRKIRQEASKKIGKAFNKSARPIRQLVKSELERSISLQPEYGSIIGGILRFEFGIPNGISRLSEIVNIWLSGLSVKVINHGALSTPIASIEIRAVEEDYKDVFASSAAELITERQTSGTPLEWLKWLLLETRGQNGIVRGYSLGRGRGRAGSFIMIKNPEEEWSVPSIFQGSSTNNFVTRAIEQIEPVLENRILSIIGKALDG